jgi:hypothetical protein
MCGVSWKKEDILEGLGVRWEYNITIDPKELGSAVVDQINLAGDSDTWWGCCERGNGPWVP